MRSLILALTLVCMGCGSGPGREGVPGANGSNGINGANGSDGNSLTITSRLTCIKEGLGWASGPTYSLSVNLYYQEITYANNVKTVSCSIWQQNEASSILTLRTSDSNYASGLCTVHYNAQPDTGSIVQTTGEYWTLDNTGEVQCKGSGGNTCNRSANISAYCSNS